MCSYLSENTLTDSTSDQGLKYPFLQEKKDLTSHKEGEIIMQRIPAPQILN